MTQIVENWSDVTGSVTDVNPEAAPVPGFVTLRLSVERVDLVEGSPNLLEDVAGSDLEVQVPAELVQQGVPAGSVVRCRVRKATNGAVFAHPEGLRIER